MATNKFAITAAVLCAGLILTFPAASTASVDRFGVKQIYTTKAAANGSSTQPTPATAWS